MTTFLGYMTSLILFYGFPELYQRKGWMKWFFHDIFHCHQPDENTLDKSFLTGVCKYCGKKIKLDNYGNWY